MTEHRPRVRSKGGRPRRSEPTREVAGWIPKELADQVLEPVGSPQYKTQTARVEALLRQGLAAEAGHIDVVASNGTRKIKGNVPESLAAEVLAPVEDGTVSSITARLASLMHYALQVEPSTTPTQTAFEYSNTG